MYAPSELAAKLREALPVHLSGHADALSQLINDASTGRGAGAAGVVAPTVPPGLAAAIEALAGKSVGSAVTFGAGTSLGEVRFGDVAGETILKLNVQPVGRDVMHSVIVQGDGNRVFTGEFESLRDAYISPDTVFQRVAIDRFARREWLAREVDEFFKASDRGYFILEAEAGLGKTAFMAWLVKQRSYIHLFVEQSPGAEGMVHGVRSLAAQVIRTWDLRGRVEDGVLPRAASRPDFLDGLLREAARARDLRRRDEPIVLVVDGLDEAGAPAGLNPLGLPPRLPKGVYVVAAYRIGAAVLNVDEPKRPFQLKAGGKNRNDMRSYLQDAAARLRAAGALDRARGSGDDDFVRALIGKCDGVWIYMRYIMDEIERGERAPLDLDELPDNLWEY